MERRVSESHSDSDSGESWMLLDLAPSYTTTESPSPSPMLSAAQSNREGADKDDDTDGISIISECESDTNESCEHVQREECASAVTVASRAVERDDDCASDYRLLLGNDAELKTYVHRRNTRVSSALNVIVLGSVVTAACLAIGHMWGVRDECVHQNSSSVNKLLSNLYKLREENAFLRSKLRELTLAGHAQLQVKRNSTPKQCQKVAEEPLQRFDNDGCVDAEVELPFLKYAKTEPTPPKGHVEIDENEKQFQNDLEKLRKMYQENRGWLERQLNKRLKNEKDLANGRVRQPPKRLNANVKINEKGIERNGVFRAESNTARLKVPAATRGDRTKESRRASSSNEINGQELKLEEERLTKLKRQRFANERTKNRDAKIKNEKHEAKNGGAKMRDGVGSRDKKYSPDYDMHLNYIGKFSHSKRKREPKTNFVIVDGESDGSKRETNDSAGDSLVGDWSQRRSEMRRRARQEMRDSTPRRDARASGRWYFRRMREREQLRARSARSYAEAR